jgi:hypothetical protein
MPTQNIVVDNLEGSALTEFELPLTNQPPLSLGNLVVFQKARLMETISGDTRYEYTMTTQHPDVVNRLIKSVMSTGTPRFRARVGYGTPQKAIWLPWQEHYIVDYAADVRAIGNQSGHAFNLVTSDAFYAFGRANKTIIRKGLISAMVREIAAENRLTAVVEETKSDYFFIQSYIDDIAFIKHRLLNRAVNAKGRGNYLFYMRDNVLHFHTPDYQTEVKEWHYYSSPHSVLTQKDNSQVLWDDGCSGTRLISYDPYTGDTQEVVNQPDQTLRLANSIYQLANVKGGQLNIQYHLSANRPEEAINIALNVYSRARQQTFELVGTFSKTVNIRVGDIVKLIITPDKDSSPWSGFYVVSRLVYEISNGAVIGTFLFTRGEIARDTSNVVTQIASSQLVPETEAPGQDLNVQETQASARTKGAGKQASTTVFSTVVDANSGN